MDRKGAARDSFIEHVYRKVDPNLWTIRSLRNISQHYLKDHFLDLTPHDREQVIDLVIEHHRKYD